MFSPQNTLSKSQIQSGLKWLYVEGIGSFGLDSIVSSGLLTAYALALGASIFQVGFLGATPFIFQPLQLLFVPMTDALCRRKLVATTTWFVVILIWIPFALLPFLDLSPPHQIVGLMILASLQGILRPLIALNWQSWLRDLIPGPVMGNVFARRLALGSMSAIVFSLAASLFVDYWRTTSKDHTEVQGFSFVLLFGVATLGMLSFLSMARIPELRMFRRTTSLSTPFQGLGAPFKDSQFRRLLMFLFMRTFYVALATPFFAVYMLQQLAYPISVVIAFTALSQLTNASILPLWGRLVDWFGAKAVMLASGSLMALVLPLWSLLASVDRGTAGSQFLVYTLIAFCMAMLGMSAAGTNVATGVMTMKRAKEQTSNAYLSIASVAGSLGAGLGPLIGGLVIDVLLQRHLTIHVEWSGPAFTRGFTGLHFGGYEFLFQLAFLFGLIASHLLAHLHEGEYQTREVVVDALFKNSADMVRSMSAIPGIRYLHAPVALVSHIPGMDTVLGLTLHQFSNAIRLAVETSQSSTRSARALSIFVRMSLARVLRGQGDLEVHAEEIACQAARGAAHAIWDLDTDPQLVIRGSLLGIAQEMGARMDPKGARRALRGIIRGVVRGAHESRQDLPRLVPTIFTAGMQAAAEMEISPARAARIIRDALIYTSRRIGYRVARSVDTQLDVLMRDKPQGVPMCDKPQGVLMRDKPQDVLMRDKPQGVLMRDKLQDVLMRDKLQDVP